MSRYTNRPNQWGEARGGHSSSVSSSRTVSNNPQSDSSYPRYPQTAGGRGRGGDSSRGGGSGASFNNRNFSGPATTVNEVLSNYYEQKFEPVRFERHHITITEEGDNEGCQLKQLIQSDKKRNKQKSILTRRIVQRFLSELGLDSRYVVYDGDLILLYTE